MVMKPLLVFLLILIFSKGTESNPLVSKLWPFSNDFQKVTYDSHSYKTYFDKLFLKIAYLFRDFSIFNDFSYKVTKTENEAKLEYRCKSSIFGAKTFVFNLEKQWVDSYDTITIEKCLEHLIGCSPNNIDSLIDFIKNKVPASSTFIGFLTSSTFFSISKTLPNQHNLTINDFINDKEIVTLQHHVKLALLYVDEENYFLITDNYETDQFKLGNTKKRPTLYILYDAVEEKIGISPEKVEEPCKICGRKVINKYPLPYFFGVHGHMKCFYRRDIKKYNGNLEELLMKEEMPKYYLYNQYFFYNSEWKVVLFNRFFSFYGLMTKERENRDFNHEILNSINYFIKYSKELNNSFNNSKDKSYDNFVNGEMFKLFEWKNYWKEYELLSKNLVNRSYPDISEISKPICLKINLLISIANNTEVSYNVKEIFELISDIDIGLKMLKPMIPRIVAQNFAKLIKKYDCNDSSIENLLALE
jgi:hypothetical protein